MRLVCQPSKVVQIIHNHLVDLCGYSPQKISLHIQREVIHAMLGSAEVLLTIFEKYSDLKMVNNHGSSIESVGAQIRYSVAIYENIFPVKF